MALLVLGVALDLPTCRSPAAAQTEADEGTGRLTIQVDVGFEDFEFGSGVDESDNRVTASKPESKLWYTADGIWWGVLHGSALDAFTIHRLDMDAQVWRDTGVLVDERGHSRQDALLDGATLYVTSRFGDVPEQNRLLRFSYHAGDQSYTLDPGFPVEIPGGGTESLTIAKDSTGTLWVAYTLDRWVNVSHTVGRDDLWTEPFVVPIVDEDPGAADVAADDIAGVVAIDGAIGVFWSNQATHEDYFAVHPDGAPSADPAAWGLEVAATGGHVADDHFNMKLAGDGRLFVAVKTSFIDASETRVGLLVREPDGTWSALHNVATVAQNPTRPLCLLDEVRRQVHVFYSLDATAIFTKASNMDSIAFPDPGGPGTAFIASTTTDDINNPTSTKQNVGAGGRMAVLASSATNYWHNTAPGPTVPGDCADPETSDGTACDDDNLCTRLDSCVGGVCVGGDRVVCAPLDGCHLAGVCNPDTGQCSNPTVSDGLACNDGNACTTGDRCIAGACRATGQVECVTPGGCREAGTCDPATGACTTVIAKPDFTAVSFTAAADAYTDGRSPFSNFGRWVTLEADDRWERRIYLRFAVTGLGGAAVQSAVIRMQATERNDSKSNHGGDIYVVGHGWNELTLTHANRPALVGKALDGVGSVQKGERVEFDVTPALSGDGTYEFAIESLSRDTVVYHSREASSGRPVLVVTRATPCDDGSKCTTGDHCVAGECVGESAVSCEAPDDCHWGCDPATGKCSMPAKPDGTSCDDGDACTRRDACEGGVCVGGEPVVCAAAGQCRDGGACDPVTGACVGGAKADGTPCDDGDACTRRDACADGVCIGRAPVVCAAAGQCRQGGACDPVTGACVDMPKPDGAPCDDANACTVGDACQGGTCVGGAPVQCAAPNGCQLGTCDPATGACVGVPKADGTACDDGNACTQGDTCEAGRCMGGAPVACVGAAVCVEAGTCDPATGVCVGVPKADGTACDDGNACTLRDVCAGGVCEGGDPVVCAAPDQCHEPGRCDPASGACSSPPKRDGAACDDGDACTRADACANGRCLGTDPVACPAGKPCDDAGQCDPMTGECVSVAVTDGAPCDDGDACSVNDACVAGVCRGEPAPDRDADGLCDPIDVCPEVADPDQSDTGGDACLCTAPAPNRCLMGGGSKRTDCLVEYLGAEPATLLHRGGRVRHVLQCADGDPGCDIDGTRDGTCTFGVSMCFGNADPRLRRCSPESVIAAEVLRPKKGTPAGDADNGARLEEAFGALGLEVRRRGRMVREQVAPVGGNRCSPAVALEVPTPRRGRSATRLRFRLRAESVSGRRDTDRFVLVCR